VFPGFGYEREHLLGGQVGIIARASHKKDKPARAFLSKKNNIWAVLDFPHIRTQGQGKGWTGGAV
jgi:hypothetical protein